MWTVCVEPVQKKPRPDRQPQSSRMRNEIRTAPLHSRNQREALLRARSQCTCASDCTDWLSTCVTGICGRRPFASGNVSLLDGDASTRGRPENFKPTSSMADLLVDSSHDQQRGKRRGSTRLKATAAHRVRVTARGGRVDKSKGGKHDGGNNEGLGNRTKGPAGCEATDTTMLPHAAAAIICNP